MFYFLFYPLSRHHYHHHHVISSLTVNSFSPAQYLPLSSPPLLYTPHTPLPSPASPSTVSTPLLPSPPLLYTPHTPLPSPASPRPSTDIPQSPTNVANLFSGVQTCESCDTVLGSLSPTSACLHHRKSCSQRKCVEFY